LPYVHVLAALQAAKTFETVIRLDVVARIHDVSAPRAKDTNSLAHMLNDILHIAVGQDVLRVNPTVESQNGTIAGLQILGRHVARAKLHRVKHIDADRHQIIQQRPSRPIRMLAHRHAQTMPQVNETLELRSQTLPPGLRRHEKAVLPGDIIAQPDHIYAALPSGNRLFHVTAHERGDVIHDPAGKLRVERQH
jgi:hypothetical protein